MPKPGISAPDEADVDRHFVIAVARAFELLRCWTPAQPLLGVSELARRSGLPKATVSRLTYTLELLGYLRRDAPSGRYALAWGVASLAYPLLTASTIRQQARPHMQELTQRLRVNTNLATLDGLHALYIETVRFDESSKARPDVGLRYPLLVSILGRTLLATMKGAPAQRLRNRLQIAEPTTFAKSWPDVELARQSLRKQGYLVAPSELHPGFLMVAAPLLSAAEGEPMAMNCSIPVGQYSTSEVRQTVGPLVLEAARAIDTRMQGMAGGARSAQP